MPKNSFLGSINFGFMNFNFSIGQLGLFPPLAHSNKKQP
jgi:hypothetical protein